MMVDDGRKAEVEVFEENFVNEGGFEELGSLGIGTALVDAIREMGVEGWFEMQASVVRCLLSLETSMADGDVVISAPTGSGKTLAYAAPVVEILRHRAVKRLRALVITPTRDLAAQVKAVFEKLCEPVGLCVSLAVGGSAGGSLRKESENLGKDSPDILIATPGRLIHHVKETPGFTLSYLRFLILDESDRLLQQDYNNWVNVVVPIAGRSTLSLKGTVIRNERGSLEDLKVGSQSLDVDFETWNSVRKILASATQTRNPRRVAGLKLRRVRRFISDTTTVGDEQRQRKSSRKATKFVTPASLSESGILVHKKKSKPAALLTLLGIWKSYEENVMASFGSSVIVFTKSITSAHKLARFLELGVFLAEIGPEVLEFSSSLTSERRAQVVADLQRQNIATVVVCSDAMARGIDATGVDSVINYDIPAHVKTYLHRVGRTARAGRSGKTATILLPEQARFFKQTIQLSHRSGEENVPMRDYFPEELNAAERNVPRLLQALQAVVRREELGLINPDLPIDIRILREVLNVEHDDPHVEINIEEEDEPPQPHISTAPTDANNIHRLLRAQIANNYSLPLHKH